MGMEKQQFVDTHCHLDMLEEDEIDLSVEEIEIIITVGCDREEIDKAVYLAEKYDGVYASVGFHPYEADTVSDEDIEALKVYIDSSKKVVAVGEAGLDFYKNTASKENQYKTFLYQINLAKQSNLPIIIHSREANREMAGFIKSENIDNGVMHCFGGDINLLKTALDNGLYISFAGNITYPKADSLREMLKYVPLDRLLLETDSPYLAPQQVRGQKNKPSNIKHTYHFTAELLGIDIEKLINTVYNNTKNLFRIT